MRSFKIAKQNFEIVICLFLLCVCNIVQNNNATQMISTTMLIGTICLFGIRNLRLLFVFSLLFMDFCGGLLPQKIAIFGQRVLVSDVSIILVLITLITIIINNRGKLKYEKNFLILSFFVLLFILLGATNANIRYSQSMLIGVATQRQLIVYLMLPFIVPVVSSPNIKRDLEKAIKISAIFLLVLYSVQYISLYALNYTFLNCTISNRMLIRLHLYPRTLFLLFLVLLQNIYTQKAKNTDYLLILFYFIVIFGMGQYRMMTFGSLVIFMLIMYFVPSRSKNIVVLRVLFIITVILAIPEILNIVTYFTQTMKGAVNSATVRSNAKSFYLEELKNSEWIGVGAINNTDGVSDELLGTKYGFYLIDLGAFAIKFMYGMCGYVFYYMLLLIALIKGNRLRLYNKNVYLVLFAVYSLLTSSTLATSYYYSVSTLFIILLSYGGVENNDEWCCNIEL